MNDPKVPSLDNQQYSTSNQQAPSNLVSIITIISAVLWLIFIIWVIYKLSKIK